MKEYRHIGPDHGKTILVVGADDVLETHLLHSIQQKTPYHVHRVFTGAQALQFASTSTVDLMLLSFYLPDMTGPDLYDRLDKTGGEEHHLPAVLLNAALPWKELEYRNIICLTQPLDQDYLLQTLDTLFLFPQCPLEAV